MTFSHIKRPPTLGDILGAIRDRAIVYDYADAGDSIPETGAVLLRMAGYWRLAINCEGDPDPGVLWLWFPGERLELVLSIARESKSEIQPETERQVRSEIAAWLESKQ